MRSVEQDYFDRQEEHDTEELKGFADGLDGVPPERDSSAYFAGWQEGREYGQLYNRIIEA